ncbi:hypothetical protein BC829DRAFT_479939 [Chytridium lagenaria]|nr:hypothetical protein BC829DRAFT_479939 [Chytridium lagenaria]
MMSFGCMRPCPAPSSGVVRARSVSSSSSTSTFSIDGYTSMNATSSSPPPPLSASPSKQERRLLSLSSKLSYASLIASTQSETIRELESLLAKRETEVERLTASIAELGFRAEHSGVMGQTRDRAIDELTKRIQALEAERSAWHLNRRSMLGTPQPESPRDRPASLQYARRLPHPSYQLLLSIHHPNSRSQHPRHGCPHTPVILALQPSHLNPSHGSR